MNTFGAGCILAIPIALGAGFFQMLKFAQTKEHQHAHQVEDLELHGDAAKLQAERLTAKEALEKFVAKLERNTEQFSKMGGKFSPEIFEREKEYLQSLKDRVAEEPESEPECKTLIRKAEQCLMQYQP